MSEAPESPLIGKVIAGRWKVVERIGEGGVGAVFKGEHAGMGRPVAIKVLHSLFAAQPEFRKRFEREARSASQLSHPACVSVLDFGEFEGQLYLVMEFAPGRLLADRLDEGPMSPTETVVIARGIAAALRHAHGLGIVHRDLKPGNVMLLEKGATGVPCKLLDFGLAKSLAGSGEQLTVAGTVFGTPGYLSPEQAQGANADARSDLYALGIVMWEMLVGEKPFHGADPIAVLRAHIEEPAPPVRQRAPRASLALEAVIARLLEKNPARRYASAEEVIAALEQVPEVTGVARTEAAMPAAPRPVRPIIVHDPEPEPEPRRPPPPGSTVELPQIARLPVALIALGTVAAIGLFVVAALVWRGAHSTAAHAPTKLVLPPDVVKLPDSEPDRLDPSAQKHLAKAREYGARLWCGDSFKEYERAIELDPTVRSDPRTVGDGIRCLTESRNGRGLAVRFLAEVVGPPAEPRLRELAANSRSPDVRRAAEEALAKIK